MIQVLLFLCFTILHVTSAATSKCTINVKTGMHKTSPPLLVSPSSPPTYIYPSVLNPGNIVLNKGDKILIVCPGHTNQKSSEILEPGVILVKNEFIESNTEEVECMGNDEFKIQEYIVNFKEISCEEKTRASYSAILKPSNKECFKGKRFEIGYDLGKNFGFLKTIELCHDVENAKTLWSHAIIEPVNRVSSRYSNGAAKNFKTGILYEGMSMSKEEPYNLRVAYNTLGQLLGYGGNVDDYLSPKVADRKFLAKGHLIANADKIYKSEQESTYFYANVVPMWQTINANPGNWYFVEEFVRHLANEKGRKLEAYVGGLGTLSLEGNDFYLYKGVKIPVPKVLFKCVVDEKMAQGLCFLVANNPYIKENEIEDYVVCERSQVCNKVAENYKNTKLGYLYCCSIRNFYEAANAELGIEVLRPMMKYKEMKLMAIKKKHQMI